MTCVEIEVENKAEKADVQELKGNFENLKENVEKIEESMTKIAQEISNTNKNVQLAASEQDEKAKRSKNLIIRGIVEPESNEEGKDKETAMEIFTQIGVPDAKIENIQRIGKKNPSSERPRVIRVVLDSEEAKWKIVGRATKIRGITSPTFDSKKIYIVPDLTKLERQREAELHKELKARREADPNGRFKIKKGKIIQVPSDQQPQPPNGQAAPN